MAVEAIQPSRPTGFKSLNPGRALVLTATAVMSVVLVAFFPVMFHRLHVIDQISSAGSVDPFTLTVTKAQSTALTAAHHSDDQVRALVDMMLAMTAVLGTCFIFWFHRAYANLRALGSTSLSRGTGWAVGAWFIPFGSMVIPKQMADELWRASDPGTPTEEPNRAAVLPTLIHTWWATWLGGGVLAFVINVMVSGSDTAGSLRTRTWGFLVIDLVFLVSLATMVAVVRQITRREHLRAQRRAAAGL